MGDVAPHVLALLALAGFVAGWVDAVVGGGGLVQLPALLLGMPGATPAQVLATNKFGSVWGTATASVTYYRRVRPDLRTALPMAAVAYVGAIGGALLGLHIPKSLFNPVILVMLVVVGAYTLLKPSVGELTRLRWSGARHTTAAVLTGFVIGVYDGALGPGTGSFLVFALVGLLGYAFLEASAKAKITNLATNLGALTVFAPGGTSSGSSAASWRSRTCSAGGSARAPRSRAAAGSSGRSSSSSSSPSSSASEETSPASGDPPPCPLPPLRERV